MCMCTRVCLRASAGQAVLVDIISLLHVQHPINNSHPPLLTASLSRTFLNKDCAALKTAAHRTIITAAAYRVASPTVCFVAEGVWMAGWVKLWVDPSACVKRSTCLLWVCWTTAGVKACRLGFHS